MEVGGGAGSEALAIGSRAEAVVGLEPAGEVVLIRDPHKTTISAGVQQFVGSFGLNLSGGGSVFAAFVIATLPTFVLVGVTMRYFVSGLTEGAIKL